LRSWSDEDQTWELPDRGGKQIAAWVSGTMEYPRSNLFSSAVWQLPRLIFVRPTWLFPSTTLRTISAGHAENILGSSVVIGGSSIISAIPMRNRSAMASQMSASCRPLVSQETG